MLKLLGCLVGVLVILLAGETVGKKLSREYHRKFVHVLVGAFAAFWPWLISWGEIQAIGLAMAAVVALNWRLNLFKFSDKINRQTYGDIFFALAIGYSAALTSAKVIYAIAVLHLALADGAAALCGKQFGKRWRYTFYGQTKTVIGTMAFWLVSFAILAVGLLFMAPNAQHYLLLIVFLPPLLTGLENLSVYGLDNFMVPVVAVAALNTFAIS